MNLTKRFWLKVAIRNNNECWNWKASIKPNGYGQFRLKEKIKYAHRTAWELTNGKIPDDICILHYCDNPKCCNPNHLFLGTHQDNIADRVAKGRTARGSKHYKAKLTEDNVKDIKKLLSNGILQKRIAKIYSVTSSIICDINRGKSWTHIQ